ncbi:MAG: hypothetical protein EBS53_12555, partial [Bacteroidetes bacterium]|nr:hypothetical protein [Bacteroidota bacterium]
IINNEPIAAKIIREKSTKLSIKTNYLQGFATDKHKTQSKNPAKPSLSFEKSFVSHGAIDYDFVLMEAKREEEMLHHEMHGHDSHGDDGSAATREGPLTPPFAEPYYSFLTLTSPPIASISASYCGETNISGNTFYNTSYDGSFQSFDGLYWIAFGFGEIAEAWSIFDFISFIELYRNTIDFREDVVPLTGWVSLDPSYDPVPTLSLSSTPESFFCGNIDDSPPSFGPEDFFPNNDYTVLYATTSSSRVPSIKTLYFSNLAIQNANFSKFTSLSSLTLRYSTSIEALDLSKNNQLQYLNLDNCISLSSLNLNSNNLKQVYLAAAPLLHDSVDAMFASVYASPNASYFGYLGTSEGRSAASNNAFIDLYKRNVQVLPLEIDPSYPVLNPPDYYVSSSLQGNSLSIMNPVSTLGASITRSKTLTGVYLKTGDVLNNRDVFRNNKDYCVVYNSNLKLWTLVGPGSSSTTVWLSADAGVGDWGNPPNLGWRGIAYSVGNDASNRWWQTTRLQTTQTMATI